MDDSFRSKIGQGRQLIGTILTLPSPEVAEILGAAGFDWLFVDLEHGAMDVKDAQMIAQAAGLPCAVRVPANGEVWIKQALDIGAQGIIVPLVRTAAEAAAAVRCCKYPPAGARSVGIARAQGYGQDFQRYVASANEEIAVIVQIEHVDAVRDIEEIVAVPGIDALFIGPYDLSASMGKIGQVTDPEVQAAITRVRACAMRAGIPLGIFGATAEAVTPYLEQGYTLVAVGIDTLLLGNAAKAITERLAVGD